MRVYFITTYPFPYGVAGTSRLQCYAKSILAQGVECKVLIYVRTESCKVKRGNSEGCGVFEGIPFEYISHTPFRDNGLIKRKWCDLLDRKRLLSFLYNNLNQGDIVYYFASNELIWIPLVIKVSHQKKAFFVKELCELPYGTTKETIINKLKRNFIFKHQFPMYDGIVSISDSLLSLAKEKSSDKTKHLKVPIMVDYTKFALPDNSSMAKEFYIFHAGSMFEQKDGFVGMIEAFGIASRKLNHQIKFISTGNINKSPHAEEVREIINKYDIKDDIRFTGYLNNEELRDYLSKASVVIINKYKTQQNIYCFSTKLAEYLAASKPVIITRVGEAMNWLSDREDAYVIEPHNVNELADAIVTLYQNKELRKKIEKGGNILCQNSFRYEVYGKTLANFFASFS